MEGQAAAASIRLWRGSGMAARRHASDTGLLACCSIVPYRMLPSRRTRRINLQSTAPHISATAVPRGLSCSITAPSARPAPPNAWNLTRRAAAAANALPRGVAAGERGDAYAALFMPRACETRANAHSRIFFTTFMCSTQTRCGALRGCSDDLCGDAHIAASCAASRASARGRASSHSVAGRFGAAVADHALLK